MSDEIALFEYVAALLADRRCAQPCATFPLDASAASSPGVYAFHGDAEADRLLGAVLGEPLHPLLADHAGGMSFRTRRASSATLKSAVGRTHLRGSTQSSSFRREAILGHSIPVAFASIDSIVYWPTTIRISTSAARS
jgi:hypothetical protein